MPPSYNDPTASIRINRSVIDTGDRSATYVFDPADTSENVFDPTVGIIGGGRGSPLFSGIASLSNPIELTTDGGVTAASDLVTLVERALAGQGGQFVDYNASTKTLVIEAFNDTATNHNANDLYKFVGDFAVDAFQDALAPIASKGVDIGDKRVQTAIRDYDNPDADGAVFLGANLNNSDLPQSNELRALVGASLTETDAGNLLKALLEDDGSRFTEGLPGQHAFTELTVLESNKIELQLTNRVNTSLKDTITLFNDWESFIDDDASTPDFASVKSDFDIFIA